MSAFGHPLAGDTLYGGKEIDKTHCLGRVFLHSWRLSFTHPVTGLDLSFTSHLPGELRHVLSRYVFN